MQLKHPDLTGSRPMGSSAAAATVEAVEARWRAEHHKERAAQLRKTVVSFFSWMFLLLVIPGAAWYFYGDRVLPPEWTFPQVYERLMKFVNPGTSADGDKVEEPKTDPVDQVTAKQRAVMKAVIKQLDDEKDGVCLMEPPLQAKRGLEDKLKATSVRRIFTDLIAADRSYQEACERLDKMNAKNNKLGLQRQAEGAAKNRQYLAQYSEKELANQQIRINTARAMCAKERLRVLERAHQAIKAASAKWTGSESRADVSKMLAELEDFHDRLLAKFKDEFPDLVADNRPLRLGGQKGGR